MASGALWQQAAFYADIKANADFWFLEPCGIKISKAGTPATYQLLWALGRAVIKSGQSAKDHYARIRPFIYYNQSGSTRAPAMEDSLRGNGSYPSDHSALGWAMALLLAEIPPKRQSAILNRGY